jgi:3-deoxy-manno-octulosonate cytidylyltransferase (CMP-KDO synthetase)
MTILAVIPARYASTRLPGKPLADLGGRPVLAWVHASARDCTAFDRVVVATDSQEVAAAAAGFGAEVVMTSSAHETGTDRVAEVAGARPDADVVVNVQGDQPFVTPQMLEALVRPFRESDAPSMATLACPVRDEAALQDPNTVKVVVDSRGDALYFSRAQIPAGGTVAEGLQHIGLYAFTRDTLLQIADLPPTQLEQTERLEQLRALEHGIDIRVTVVEHAIDEINTPEDLERARAAVEAAR